MTRFGWVALVGLVALGTVGAQPRPATVVVRDESVPTARRLVEAAEKSAAGKHADAVADLQRILDAAGDDLVPVNAEHLVPARWFVHRQLAALPPDALRLYRDRIDEPARILLAKGRADRDLAPLTLLVSRYFVSRSTPDALLLLGELAFERGEYRRAELAWRQILPPDETGVLTHPDRPKDLAAVRAKVILARIFQGDRTGAAAALEALRKDFPAATGRLAGRTGPLADNLQGLLERPDRLPPDAPSRTWSTFGGDATRAGYAPGAPVRIPVVPTWVTPIPKYRGAFGPQVSPASIARSPAHHPVIVNGYAYVADAARVLQFDLRTGKATIVYDLHSSDDLTETRSVRAEDLLLPPKFDADYALTASGDRLYARLGTPAIRPGPADPNASAPRSEASVLVRLAPPAKPDPDGPPLTRDWSVKPPKAGALWEGAPVVVAGRVLAAYVRTEGDRLIHSIACYADGGAAPLWARDVADAPAADSDSPRHRHELLTLAGEAVVYCTHSGVVVAVHAATGKPAWAFRYPRTKPSPLEYRYRGACPPVAAGGRVFVAPSDADAVFALDAETGAPLWRANGLRTHHLLGVAGTKLVAAVAGPVRGVRAFDVATGSDSEHGGWRNHDDPYLATFGHGLVSESASLWPTAGGLFPLGHSDGFLAAPPVGEPQGNLAYADGVLIVATPIEIRGYVLDPAKSYTSPAGPGIKVVRADPPRPGGMSVPDDEPLPPAVPKKVAKAVPVPKVDGELLVPISADPPLAATDDGKIFRLGGDAPLALGSVGFCPSAARVIPNRDAVLLTGPDGLARVRTDKPDGVEWTVSARGYDLNQFIAAGNRVVCRAGEHHLQAFDLSTGDHLLSADAFNRAGYHPYPHPTAPRFSPHFHADSARISAHATTGHVWRYDVRTDRTFLFAGSRAEPWGSPPVSLEPGVWLTAVAPDEVAVSDAETGRIRWRFRAGRDSSLTGEMPQFRTLIGHTAVVVRRNLGVDLHLIRTDGRPAWGPRPAFLPADRFDIRYLDADGAHLYCPYDDKLAAIRIDDGAEAWTVSLPASHGVGCWVARAGAGGVIVFPTHAIPVEPVGVITERVGRSFFAWPAARRVAGLGLTLYEGWAARTVPVLVLDPNSGKELRRFDLPAVGPLAIVSFTPGEGMTVVTGTKVYTLE